MLLILLRVDIDSSCERCPVQVLRCVQSGLMFAFIPFEEAEEAILRVDVESALLRFGLGLG